MLVWVGLSDLSRGEETFRCWAAGLPLQPQAPPSRDALPTAHDYSARVRCTSNLGFVDAAIFHRLLGSSTAMLFEVLRLLSEDVNSCYDSMRDIALAK